MISESRPVRGRPLLGAFFGLLLGVFLTFDLLQMSFMPLDSMLVLAVPAGGLVVGAILGMIAVTCSMINVTGGYLITFRMIRMFKRKAGRK